MGRNSRSARYEVDGEFVEKLSDVNYPWAGSTNQRVIAVQESLRTGKVILKGEN